MMRGEVSVLVVDDEPNIRGALATILEKKGYRVQIAGTGGEALDILKKSSFFHLVLTDLRLPDIEGIDLLKRMKEFSPDSEFIVMTAYGTIESVVETMRYGAYDYLTKPIEKERLLVVLEKALEKQRLILENRSLRNSLVVKDRFERIIGRSMTMKRVYEIVDQVAGSSVTLLLVGESGTGKELVARAIHQRSPRSQGPFITMNCGAIPETLFESELFGYEKGAFTGAVSAREGRFELADKGTLLLDEIGEMSLKSQVNFLRVIETKEFHRLGGRKPIEVDVRIIAATNRNLQEAVTKGLFREDLYYRLNVVPIHLPPLRERTGDLPLLAEAFVKEFCESHQKDEKELSPEALKLMMNYSWPGNVRELKNVIERMVVMVKEKTILPEHLPPEIRTGKESEKGMLIRLGRPLKEIEEQVIRRTLAEITPHREKAAQILGISPRSLLYKIKEYGITD